MLGLQAKSNRRPLMSGRDRPNLTVNRTRRFCRMHGARTTSDPEGRVSFRVSDERQLQRYRFALRTADFSVCRTCGVYVAAVLTSPSGEFATVNVNTIRGALTVADAEPTTYDGESPEQRKMRREDQWTPVVKVA